MCLNIYISAKKEIPEIKWSDESPGFYLTKVDDSNVLSFLDSILTKGFVYEAGSHIGCSCGFSYDEWTKNTIEENHIQRMKDVADFSKYIEEQKTGNRLQIFCTMWNEFPDYYESKELSLKTIDQNEFDFEEMVILKVI